MLGRSLHSRVTYEGDVQCHCQIDSCQTDWNLDERSVLTSSAKEPSVASEAMWWPFEDHAQELPMPRKWGLEMEKGSRLS